LLGIDPRGRHLIPITAAELCERRVNHLRKNTSAILNQCRLFSNYDRRSGHGKHRAWATLDEAYYVVTVSSTPGLKLVQSYHLTYAGWPGTVAPPMTRSAGKSWMAHNHLRSLGADSISVVRSFPPSPGSGSDTCSGCAISVPVSVRCMSFLPVILALSPWRALRAQAHPSQEVAR